jgi:hypothetical protein
MGAVRTTYVYRLCVNVLFGKGLYIYLLSESNDPYLLDKLWKDFIVIPACLPW